MENIWRWDASETAERVRQQKVSAAEVLEVCLERIGRYDSELNSFAIIDPESAYEQARAVDALVAQGTDPGPLAGVPVGVKDLENAEGLPTTFGSLLFRDNVSLHDSTQVARLREAGAVIVGKTTTPELGSINYTSSKLCGVTRNPWNTERTPGGSSGGSAAAVSAGLIPLATGSDGGGSIRIPSAFTGLPGLKVTYGLVPRGPGRLAAGNLSTYGPIARSIRDIARFLDQVVGADPMDPFSIPDPQLSYQRNLEIPMEGMKAVWSSDLGFGTCEPEVEQIARSAAEKLFVSGGLQEVQRPVRLPDGAIAWGVAEALDCFSDLDAFWPEREDEMTPVVSLAMRLAETLQPKQLAEASRVRHETLRVMNEVFEECDLIFTPTTPTVAFGADGPMPASIAGRFIDNPLIGICFTYPLNLTGHPALTVPAGVDADGMPVGLQIIAPRLCEPLLLSAGATMERTSPWPTLAPNFA
ncbi:MAG: amidase [Actinomycetota bacterium]|nr:amidase [Actinomycetota bacterium]